MTLRLPGFLLIAEGVYTLFWLVQLLPSLGWRNGASVALIAARAIAGAIQLSTGWGLSSRRPSALSIAPWIFASSAALLTIELGGQLTPTNLDPTFRWPVVVAYWIYAGLTIGILRGSRATAP
jgi:hypothetical protein